MRIAELLSDRSRWTQEHYAIDAQGRDVNCMDKDSAAWCMIGATWYCYKLSEREAIIEKMAEKIAQLFPGRMPQNEMACSHEIVQTFNDHLNTTFGDVRRVIVGTGV